MLKIFPRNSQLRADNRGVETRRRGDIASKNQIEGASTLGGAVYSQKVRKLGGNCFPFSLNSIIRYFRPVKARIAKVILSSLARRASLLPRRAVRNRRARG